MKADPRFLHQTKEFWANVRTISQEIGYTNRGKGSIRVPTLTQIRKAFEKLSLSIHHIHTKDGNLTPFGKTLLDYFSFRADLLNNIAQHYLMNREEAEALFTEIYRTSKPKCPMPMNKQKAEKRNYAFLTCMVNMLIEANIGDAPCNYNPLSLTTITHDNLPLRTLARRVDGAFPSVVNPIAIWEIKEYYYTTTFGSRVADGVYETLLDGHELHELEEAANRKVNHVLFIDDHYTWWECGRSYLCRIIDILHMGYLDEVIIGREVVNRLPLLAREWKQELDRLLSDAEAVPPPIRGGS